MSMSVIPRRIKVGLELTSKCNLRCGMCPLPVLRRPYEDMAWPLVEKAEREIHGLGLKLKCLHETAEPLVHARIDDAIRLFPDGRVTHCCYDSHGVQVLGDLKTHSLREIVESDRMVQMKPAFEVRYISQLPRCGECFKYGGESHTFNDILTRVQNLPDVAK